MQAAHRLADLLSGTNMSHIFYVSMADVVQEDHCLPQAVRLTQPVYQSATHHLVYVQPQTDGATANVPLSSNSNRYHIPAAVQDRWGSGNSNSNNSSRQRSAADQTAWNSSIGIGDACGGTGDTYRRIGDAHGGSSSKQALLDAEQNVVGSNAELSQSSAVTGGSISRQRSPGGDAEPQKYCPPHRRQYQMLAVQFATPHGPLDARACFGFTSYRKIALLLFSVLGCFRGRTNFVADRLNLHIVCCNIESYMFVCLSRSKALHE
ncbi:hypothetical protein WJX77_010789 [Trebouxia sp. C0004]